jgi:hypothetical protein
VTSDSSSKRLVAPSTVVVRRAFGLLRIAAGLLVFASIATQIGDKLLNDVFKPEEYFSYFTIQTSLGNIVVFLIGGWLALRQPKDPLLFTSVRMSMVAYAVVTAVVYAALLRNIPPEGYVGIGWPNEVLHVGIPIFIALDWLLAPGRPRVPWRVLSVSLIYPAAWLTFTLLRGALTLWYPYPFLEPFGPGGWGGVIAYILGIAGFVVAMSALAIGISRFSHLFLPGTRGTTPG